MWHSTFERPPATGRRVLVSHGDEVTVGELFRTPAGLKWFVEGAWHAVGRWPFWLPPPAAPLRVSVSVSSFEEPDELGTFTLRLEASVTGFRDEILETSADAETRALPGWSWAPAGARLLSDARKRLAHRFGIAPEAILFTSEGAVATG